MTKFAGSGPFRVPEPGERAGGANEGPRCPKHVRNFLLKEADGWWCDRCNKYVKVKR